MRSSLNTPILSDARCKSPFRAAFPKKGRKITLLIHPPARSHGNVSHHLQVSLNPKINHTKFRVYSGFGQQLGPIVIFNAGGVIDGLAAIFPKTVSKLFALASKRPVEDSTLEEVRRLQWKVSTAEEFIGKHGILGIRQAIYKVLGFGHLEGGRLPLKGAIAPGAYEQWDGVLGQMIEEEKKL